MFKISNNIIHYFLFFVKFKKIKGDNKMKTFSYYKKIALIFAIIVIFACAVICTVKITSVYVLKHLEIDYTSNNNIAITYNGETEIYKTPIIQ